MTSSIYLLFIFEYLIFPIDFVHVFEALYWSLNNIESALNLHPVKALVQDIFQMYAGIMTSSCDLLWNFE